MMIKKIYLDFWSFVSQIWLLTLRAWYKSCHSSQVLVLGICTLWGFCFVFLQLLRKFFLADNFINRLLWIFKSHVNMPISLTTVLIKIHRGFLNRYFYSFLIILFLGTSSPSRSVWVYIYSLPFFEGIIYNSSKQFNVSHNDTSCTWLHISNYL